jgi:hypothetical protein
MKEEVYSETVSTGPVSFFRRVSWGAIFSGLLVSLVIQLMLTLLGVAVGASTFNPMRQPNPGHTYGLASVIWLLVSGLVSIFIGSCVAGRLSGVSRRADGLLHGIVTWSAATALTVLLLASATGAVIGGMGTLLSSALQSPNSENLFAGLQQQIQVVVPNAGGTAVQGGRETGAAQSNVNSNQQSQAATIENASRDVSKAAWWGFIALFLELAVAAWGGWAGASSLWRARNVETTAVA